MSLEKLAAAGSQEVVMPTNVGSTVVGHGGGALRA